MSVDAIYVQLDYMNKKDEKHIQSRVKASRSDASVTYVIIKVGSSSEMSFHRHCEKAIYF
jgi:hypothetical protein